MNPQTTLEEMDKATARVAIRQLTDAELARTADRVGRMVRVMQRLSALLVREQRRRRKVG